MSDNEPPQHLHLLSSYEVGWDGLNLIYEREPADEIPESWFAQHLILICLDDVQANFMLKGNWYTEYYTNGDIIIFPASQPFPRTQVDREFTLIDLYLEPTVLISAVAESVDTDKIELVPQMKLSDPLIQHMGLALKAELEAGGADSRLYAESMATALAVHLLRRYSVYTLTIKDYTGGLPKYKLRAVVNYINEHLDKNLTLAELAFVVQMSPHYFSSLFKQSTGYSPHQYVTKCRIEKAKQFLRGREFTIVEICHLVGFESQSHFTRVFRQYTKMTPKAYRDAL